jgi:hypothetical protein
VADVLETAENGALGTRLVACPAFPKAIARTQPHPGWRDGRYRDEQGILWNLTPAVIQTGVWLPDLDDTATLGVLLAIVRLAWNDPGLTTFHDSDRWDLPDWGIRSGKGGVAPEHSEAAVLVVALEAKSAVGDVVRYDGHNRLAPACFARQALRLTEHGYGVPADVIERILRKLTPEEAADLLYVCHRAAEKLGPAAFLLCTAPDPGGSRG